MKPKVGEIWCWRHSGEYTYSYFLVLKVTTNTVFYMIIKDNESIYNGKVTQQDLETFVTWYKKWTWLSWP